MFIPQKHFDMRRFGQIAVKGPQACLVSLQSHRDPERALRSRRFPSVPSPKKGNETRPNHPPGKNTSASTRMRRERCGTPRGHPKGSQPLEHSPGWAPKTSVMEGARTPQVQPKASPKSKGGTRQCVDTPIALEVSGQFCWYYPREMDLRF